MSGMPAVCEPKRIAITSDLIPELAPAPLKPAATLSNLWGTWVMMKNPSRSTMESHRHMGKRFLTFFREKDLNVPTILDWCQHVNKMRRMDGTPIAPVRIHQIQSHVRSFLKFLRKTGFIRYDLWEFIKLPKLPDPKMPEIVSSEEYRRLKECAEREDRHPWALWMIILGYRSGMTGCDCAHLRWEQVFLNDESESYMDVPRMKLSRQGEKAICRIPIVPGSDLHEWLLKLQDLRPYNYKRKDGLNYVHQDCPGYHACGNMMAPVFRRIFDAAGAPTKSFASLRRTFISNLINSGMEYPLVCKITGHSGITHLLRYLRPNRKALQDGVMRAQQYAETRT